MAFVKPMPHVAFFHSFPKVVHHHPLPPRNLPHQQDTHRSTPWHIRSSSERVEAFDQSEKPPAANIYRLTSGNARESAAKSIPNYFSVLPLPLEVDDTDKILELKQIARNALAAASTPVTKMKLIDTMQRLGIAYHFEIDINILLESLLFDQQSDEELYTIALRFCLLRHNGHRTSQDVFRKFMDSNGKFKESLKEDAEGLLSLYEASYLGAHGENVLEQAMEFTKHHLKKSMSKMAPQLRRRVVRSLELPRHFRMERLEARWYIEEYSMEIDHNSVLLELAKLDYNRVQSLYKMELAEISRWWKHLGVGDSLSFARDRFLECSLWTVGILPEPKYAKARFELAKAIAILLVIDDVYDTYGSFSDLQLFTEAIRRWDLNAMEQLPEYMKICYMALYNTTNEICYNIMKEHGRSVAPVKHFLKRTWIDLVEAYMVEANWFNSSHVPSLRNYLENGITTGGSYMALVHIYFLIGQGYSDDNETLSVNPYPKLFSVAGQILRLLDDLGTAKEEQERGDVPSSIELLMRENKIATEYEGRKQILQLVHNSWKDLNGELIASNGRLPLDIIRAALNMSRSCLLVYHHEEDTYLSSVADYVKSLFFIPII